MIKRIKEYAMGTKLFWRIYFWHGMRLARKSGASTRLMPGYTGSKDK